MIIGYARTSSDTQHIENQIKLLTKFGCEKIYSDRGISGEDYYNRPEFLKMLDFLRKDDVIVVTSFDRLIRSINYWNEIKQILEEKSVTLKLIPGPLDGISFEQIVAWAEVEKILMLERQRAGVQRAKEQGKYKGRKPTAKEKSKLVLEAYDQGKSIKEICKEFLISRASFYRILKEEKQ